MPVPSSALTRGPYFAALPRRECELSFFSETEDGDEKTVVVFEGVEAYKCTYLSSLTSPMIEEAYDQHVRLDHSEWLAEVRTVISQRSRQVQQEPHELQHLLICFDGGPCYEFICADFSVRV